MNFTSLYTKKKNARLVRLTSPEIKRKNKIYLRDKYNKATKTTTERAPIMADHVGNSQVAGPSSSPAATLPHRDGQNTGGREAAGCKDTTTRPRIPGGKRPPDTGGRDQTSASPRGASGPRTPVGHGPPGTGGPSPVARRQPTLGAENDALTIWYPLPATISCPHVQPAKTGWTQMSTCDRGNSSDTRTIRVPGR